MNEAYARSYIYELKALGYNPSVADIVSRNRIQFDELKASNSEEFLKIKADALGMFLCSYAKNPPERDKYIKILDDLTYKGNIPKENYTKEVEAEYMKNTAILSLAYARNPSLFTKFIEYINEYNPYVECFSDQEYNLTCNTKYDITSNKIKAARERSLGWFTIAYARNKSLYNKFEEIFKKFAPIKKNSTPSPEEQAETVKAIAQTIYAYARNPYLKQNFSKIIEENSSVIKDITLQEVQVARAESLSMLISAINRNPSLISICTEVFNKKLGVPSDSPSERVQAITLYNSGHFMYHLCNRENDRLQECIDLYNKTCVKITSNTDKIQAASLANLGRLYQLIPFIEDNQKASVIIDYFRNNLYVKTTGNSPIIQAAKVYCDGFYQSTYQKIMQSNENEEKKKQQFKILEKLKTEFEPEIKVDYSLEEVQIAKIEFLNTAYRHSSSNNGGRYFADGYLSYNFIIIPSSEYFKNK